MFLPLSLRSFLLAAASAPVLLVSACAQTPSSDQTTAPPALTLAGGTAVPLTDSQPIIITGVEPGVEVTLIATRPYEYDAGILLRSVTTYRADDSGSIDTAAMAPVDDVWQDADAFGPFWSMRRSDLSADGYARNEVRVAVDLDGDGHEDLATSFTLRTGDGEMIETPLGERFPGAFLLRPAGSEDEALPLIVVLGGSEGGDGAARNLGPRLAVEGYAVLGLPYYSPAYFGQTAQFENLPRGFANLPVEYVAEAIAAIDDPRIDLSRVGLYGVSKGAEFVLLSGALSRTDIPGLCAIASIVPSDVVWEGWGAGSVAGETPGFSYLGDPLPFVPYVGMGETIARLSRGESASLRVPHEEGFAAYPDRVAAARIRVEDIDVPVLVAGADEDTTWNSGRMTRNIIATRKDAGLQTAGYLYPSAGHGLSGSAWRAGDRPTALARRELWSATLDFYADTLNDGDCSLD